MHPALIALVIAVLTITGVQYLRYLYLRRINAQDRQFCLHSTEAFHVFVFFKVKSGTRVVESVRAFLQRTTNERRAKLIYAGQSAFTVDSEQLGHRPFDGVVLLQYSSRLEYEERGARILAGAVAELFSDSYLHAMRRNRRANLLMPLWLLRLRIGQLLRGRWQSPDLAVQPDYPTSPRYDDWRYRVDRLQAVHKVNPTALVTLNLIKRGNATQQAAHERFGDAMMDLMAADVHGPLHTGRSVALEGNARFDDVVATYYPSADYFSRLVTSQFFHEHWSRNAVSDTVWLATVPISDSL
ncbi:MAG: hypothetical protein HKN19_06390 [Halioglobus sp.]|nr:hypothetical protein [Halioglobus sp.]